MDTKRRVLWALARYPYLIRAGGSNWLTDMGGDGGDSRWSGWEERVCVKADIDRALMMLSDVERKAVWYTAVVGLPVRACTHLVGLSKSQIHRTLKEAIEKIAASLGEIW